LLISGRCFILKEMAKLFIGTSGFSYSHWEDGVFYPRDLPRAKQLEYFTKHFDTVELNNSFYRLPQAETFLNWQKRTSPGFIFAVKVSRFITHIKKLNQCRAPWLIFLKRALNLGPKLGPFLFQFPPNWKENLNRLKDFVKIIERNNSKLRFAFEFRHSSWFIPEVYQFFRKYKNLSFCLIDSPYWPTAGEITGDFVYIRMHGGKILYGSNYSKKELKQLADRIKKYLKQGLDIYCYFNNDASGFAVKNAKQLLKFCKSY